MNFENITFTVTGGIARITLNRPDKLNSFTDAMHAELRVALDAIQNREGVGAAARVLVLTGAGRGFSAGQDLGDRAMQIQSGKLPDIGNTVERNYKPLALRLQNLRVPTIAAVNGIAAGAGCSVALCCDLVVATHGALTAGVYSTKPEVIEAMTEATWRSKVALSINLTGGVFVNQSAAYSDYHGTGGNPAANASYADSAFVANRFRVVQRRYHA